jgi:hypothetical protein
MNVVRHTWYLSPSCSSLSSMLPPRHSVTLKPSSLSSPVNSRLTPPSREPHAAWILIQEVSSLMIVPKLRVLKPLLEVSVLRIAQSAFHIVEDLNVLSVHGIAHPCDRVSRTLDGFDVASKVVPDLDGLVKSCWRRSGMNALFRPHIW